MKKDDHSIQSAYDLTSKLEIGLKVDIMFFTKTLKTVSDRTCRGPQKQWVSEVEELISAWPEAIQVLERRGQKDCESEVSLGFIERFFSIQPFQKHF